MKKKILIALMIILLVVISFSGCIFNKENNNDNVKYEHTVTRIYSIEIKSNDSYTIFLPIAIDQNGISSLMDNVKVQNGNAEIEITEVEFGKCLKVSGSGNNEIYSSEEFKCHFTEGGEDVLVPQGTNRPEKMTLSMSNIFEIVKWGEPKEYYHYNTSTTFELKERDWAKERMHTMGSIAWKIYNDTENTSYSLVKAENIKPKNKIEIDFLLAEDHLDNLWYQDQWEGTWYIDNGWNKCYFYQDHPSSCFPE